MRRPARLPQRRVVPISPFLCYLSILRGVMFGAKMDLPTKVSTADLAKLLSVNERTITKLVDKKVLRRESRGTFDTVDAVAAYVAHREGVVAAEQGVGDYGKARAQLYLERARAARIKREQLEGSLVKVADVVAFNVGIVTLVKNRLLGVPTKVAPRLVGLKNAAEAEALVRAEVYEALTEIARLNDVGKKKDVEA